MGRPRQSTEGTPGPNIPQQHGSGQVLSRLMKRLYRKEGAVISGFGSEVRVYSQVDVAFDMLLLAVFNVLFFMLSYAFFLRYDVT